ncbi:hypothetical protein GCM10010259_37890 [Streptomyces daghestanicus]|uniref:Uncharacterized protein n=1 Tax=Streptomyces daghestanicus TaxID=66885 RepID=A0ABQ3QAT7_9ACTN|nr:hypothetical protein GCM10010259_37890 [Streptomyces daghestanicus]GHI34380.1 hypothetical protein Sdagh_61100 [Streptomyces daghestanicus]
MLDKEILSTGPDAARGGRVSGGRERYRATGPREYAAWTRRPAVLSGRAEAAGGGVGTERELVSVFEGDDTEMVSALSTRGART